MEVWANEIRCEADFEKSLSTAKRWPSKLLNEIPTAFLEKFLIIPFFKNSFKNKAEQILVEKKASLLLTKYGERGVEALIQANHLPNRLRPLAESFLAHWRSAQLFGFQEQCSLPEFSPILS